MNAPPQEPLVSIITPAHNAARCLPETIASVLGQTYTNWEWIIADDASTDDTAAVVHEASRTDGRIRFVQVPAPNGNAARARNAAMASARGELFAFLDADDLWLPEKLARQVDHLGAHPESAGVCTWHRVFGEGEAAQRKRAMQRFTANHTVRREEMILNCPFQTSTLAFRSECYHHLGGMDEDPRLRSGQDYEYFARLLNAYRVDRIPEILVHYRVADEPSLSARHVQARNERGWRILEVFEEKGLLRPGEMAAKRAALYYEQAKDNLFHLRAPFRGALWHAVRAGNAPAEAWITLALSILPAPALRALLLAARGGLNHLRVRR